MMRAFVEYMRPIDIVGHHRVPEGQGLSGECEVASEHAVRVRPGRRPCY